MDNAAKVGLHRSPALAELFESLGGTDALSTLAELLDELPMGVALIGVDDGSFPLLYLNSRASTIAEADSEELIGRPLKMAFPAAQEMVEAVREAHEQAGRRNLRYRAGAGKSWQFEAVSLRRARRGGASVLATWHEARDQAAEPANGGRPGPPEASTEVAGSPELYDRAQKTARRLQVGVDVAMEVAPRLEPEEVVERVLRRALEAVEADRAMLARLDGGLQCTILGSVERSDQPPMVGLTVSLAGQEPAIDQQPAARSGSYRVRGDRAAAAQVVGW